MANFDPYAYGAKQTEFNPYEHGAKAVGDATAELLSLANQAATPMAEVPRGMQQQEEFSNPAAWPGFQDLDKKNKLQRLAFSQFDPANLTGVGTATPPGTYESNVGRMAGSILPTLAAPEFSLGEGMLSRYAINPLLNLVKRMGMGVGSDVAYNLPEIKSKEDLQSIAKQGAYGSAGLEALTAPFRIPSYFAEMFNPVKYASQKAGQIQNEMQATKSVMDEMYRPINQAYDNFPVTITPKNYLLSSGIERADLYPDAKIIYDDFLGDPSFKNLHRFQSKLGQDWARISQHPATAEKAQLFSQMRDNLQSKVQSFLSRDPNALSQYNLASEYAKNNYFPYSATPTLRKIAKGKLDVSPNALSKSIQKGIEKTVGSGASERSLIPQGHALRNHMNDLENVMNFGKAAQFAVPTLGGAAAGELLHPGLGGMIGGAVSGLGASQLSNMASKFGAPSVTQFMQNPWVENVFRKTAPPLYLGGRMGINALSGNQ